MRRPASAASPSDQQTNQGTPLELTPEQRIERLTAEVESLSNQLLERDNEIAEARAALYDSGATVAEMESPTLAAAFRSLGRRQRNFIDQLRKDRETAYTCGLEAKAKEIRAALEIEP